MEQILAIASNHEGAEREEFLRLYKKYMELDVESLRKGDGYSLKKIAELFECDLNQINRKLKKIQKSMLMLNGVDVKGKSSDYIVSKRLLLLLELPCMMVFRPIFYRKIYAAQETPLSTICE